MSLGEDEQEKRKETGPFPLDLPKAVESRAPLNPVSGSRTLRAGPPPTSVSPERRSSGTWRTRCEDRYTPEGTQKPGPLIEGDLLAS